MAEPALKLSAARAAVLGFVVEADAPVTVQQVSASSGQHANTVREHLEALVDLGFLARRTTAPEGRGRPAIAYVLEGQTSPLRSTREYAALVDALIQRLKSTSTDVRQDALAVGRTWGEERPEGESLDALLERMGFEPIRESPRAIRLQTCPVLAAVRAHPDVVCTMHLGLLRSISRQDVDLQPFVDGGCRILFPENAADEGEPTS